MKGPRILIADDHALIRRGVRAELEKQRGWHVVGEATSAPEAVDKAKKLRPDVVVMDIQMGTTSGLDAAREVVAALPRTRVLIVTIHESDGAIREVMAAGAHGYVSKSDADAELVNGVRALLAGRTFFSSRATNVVLSTVRRGAGGDGARAVVLERITGRQRDVLRLLADGKSNKEIASTLGISVRTAESHRASLMRRLDAPTLSHLVRYAVRHGFVAD
jgi:DNA-binding NarL/FixJ family response regulator